MSTDNKKMDMIIRNAYKLALGVPPYEAIAKILRLGVNNTFQELVYAHLASQRECMALTGWHVLTSLGIDISALQSGTIRLPLALRKKIGKRT